MKAVSLVSAPSVKFNMKRLLIGIAALFAATSSSYAVTYNSVQWTGVDNFNSGSMTWTTPFFADQLVDITGNGYFEALANSTRRHPTNFNMYALIGSDWVEEWTWSSHNTSEQSLASLVPPRIALLNPGFISGLRFTSSPLNTTTDFTFSSFFSEQDYYNLNKSYYDSRHMSYDDYVKCGDYENYLKNVTTFKFEDDGLISTQ